MSRTQAEDTEDDASADAVIRTLSKHTRYSRCCQLFLALQRALEQMGDTSHSHDAAAVAAVVLIETLPLRWLAPGSVRGVREGCIAGRMKYFRRQLSRFNIVSARKTTNIVLYNNLVFSSAGEQLLEIEVEMLAALRWAVMWPRKSGTSPVLVDADQPVMHVVSEETMSSIFRAIEKQVKPVHDNAGQMHCSLQYFVELFCEEARRHGVVDMTPVKAVPQVLGWLLRNA